MTQLPPTGHLDQRASSVSSRTGGRPVVDESTGAAPQRVRVAVVFGGRSGEHSVSCVSAASVLANLDPGRYEVLAVGIARDGSWRIVDADRAMAAAAGGALPEVDGGEPVVLPADPTVGGLLRGSGAGIEPVDVVFPVLHGPYGEDGTVQGLLELAGLPYVGAGVLASAVGMDKELTKKLLLAEGLPVGDFVVLRRPDATVSQPERARLGLPVFVKPARAGSSLGVTRVDDWADLDDAVAVARAVDPKVLVEAARLGREIECGVLEFPDGRIEASPTAEISMPTDRSFYDFQAKYVEDVATFAIPADLPDVVTKHVRDLAVRAFTALDGQGLARVDFFVTDGPDGPDVVVNEVNTLPGFTPISMFPRMWSAAGVGYGDLVGVLVETALARGTGLR